ncbi:translation initiation factor eIF4A [Mortierella sp. AM989]|nr:translation initiation factor eIF4A [Mortierella sp. AM989]
MTTSVNVQNTMMAIQRTRQFYLIIEQEQWKAETVLDLFGFLTVTSFIYCNQRHTIRLIKETLKDSTMKILTMDDEMDQSERGKVTEEFRMDPSILVTMDTPGQIVEVQRVQLIVNYDMPKSSVDFAYRSTRGYGGFAPKEVVITFITEDELPLIQEMERLFSINIPEAPMNLEEYF